MAYQTAPFLVTLSDLQDHAPIVASVFNCDFSYSCIAVDEILASRGPSAIAELLVSVASTRHTELWKFGRLH